MAEHISWKKVVKADSNYLGEWDLPIDNTSIIVTIKDAVKEEVRIPAKKIIKDALVITFEEFEKKFVCNSTNGARIERALGTRVLAEWVGKKIELYVDNKVKFGSETVSAIRVKVQAPAQEKLVYHCSVCGKEISQEIYEGSVRKYGKAYCSKACLDKDKQGESLDKIIGD